jgi:crotonobetainyl-CoA:carnitine CoA-transferase CaiB-like acyl-CoA transferase
MWPGRRGLSCATAALRPPQDEAELADKDIKNTEKGSCVTRPFEGVRILDFTQVLAGPYASYQLGLLGADVIKVERREGEDMRRTPLSKEWAERGLAPGWQAINGGKRSLTLDLQKPEAIEIVKRLARKADVVMENFRPGVMDKLGIGYKALSDINPRLIYCCISAFGQTGPERLGAGYDGKIQAMSGIMAITGHEETGPTRAGFAVCDVLSGSTAAFGVASALFQRTHTGKGQLVDVSMLEATIAFLSGQVADYTVAGHRQKLSGNQAVSRRTTANLFKAGKDGFILLAVNNEKQYINLMKALGREDVLSDPRFADWFLRNENEPALRKIIEDVLATKEPKEWEKILDAAGAPCANIWKIEEIIDHPQIEFRKAIQTVDTPFGPLRFAGSGFRLEHGGGRLDRMAPALSEHTDEVLAEAGYSEDEVAALHKASVV